MGPFDPSEPPCQYEGEAPPPIVPIVPDGAVLLVLGPPGSGKDTVCAPLVEIYGCVHLSAVELLREAVTSGSAIGKTISNMMRSGQIVPAQMTLDLVKSAMAGRRGPYLLQGFPKTLDTLADLETQCGACAGAIILEVSEAVLTERLLERGKTSQRTDDTVEGISRRYHTYQLQCAPGSRRRTRQPAAHCTSSPRHVIPHIHRVWACASHSGRCR